MGDPALPEYSGLGTWRINMKKSPHCPHKLFIIFITGYSPRNIGNQECFLIGSCPHALGNYAGQIGHDPIWLTNIEMEVEYQVWRTNILAIYSVVGVDHAGYKGYWCLFMVVVVMPTPVVTRTTLNRRVMSNPVPSVRPSPYRCNPLSV